jgi:hypothetical protein
LSLLICLQAPQRPCKLLCLPTELLCIIFSYLDRTYSTCLGLASNRLYGVHFYLHKKVSLANSTIEKRPHGKIICVHLRELVKNWMGPNVVYFRSEAKFLTHEQLKRKWDCEKRMGRGSPKMCDVEVEKHERKAVRNVLRSVHGLRMLK